MAVTTPSLKFFLGSTLSSGETAKTSHRSLHHSLLLPDSPLATALPVPLVKPSVWNFCPFFLPG